MADEHYKWLDREAAERLLRGEPLEAVAGDDLRQAERLSAALHALTGLRSGPEGELPGEDVALKAFREARAVSAMDAAVTRSTPGPAAFEPVRHGRHRAGAGVPAGPAGPGRGRAGESRGPRWGRPVRFGLAAAVAACMVGGVAVAAGTGVLPSPFGGGRQEPNPATTVSSAASPDRPLASPSPDATGNEEAVPDGSATPDDGSGTPDADHSPKPPESKGPAETPNPYGTGRSSGSQQLRLRLAQACLKYRGGQLGADERQRLLRSTKQTGRSAQDLDRFCDRMLGPSDEASDPDASEGRGGGQDGDEDDDNGKSGPNNGENAGYTPIAPTRTPAPPPSPSAPTGAAPEPTTAAPSVSASVSAS